jgi:hypothetical protein
MMSLVALLYGTQITVLIYASSYFTVRAILGKSAVALMVIFVKYLVYWKLLEFGLTHLPVWAVMTGFAGSIYFSLALIYYFHQRKDPPSRSKDPSEGET